MFVLQPYLDRYSQGRTFYDFGLAVVYDTAAAAFFLSSPKSASSFSTFLIAVILQCC